MLWVDLHLPNKEWLPNEMYYISGLACSPLQSINFWRECSNQVSWRRRTHRMARSFLGSYMKMCLNLTVICSFRAEQQRFRYIRPNGETAHIPDVFSFLIRVAQTMCSKAETISRVSFEKSLHGTIHIDIMKSHDRINGETIQPWDRLTNRGIPGDFLQRAEKSLCRHPLDKTRSCCPMVILKVCFLHVGYAMPWYHVVTHVPWCGDMAADMLCWL